MIIHHPNCSAQITLDEGDCDCLAGRPTQAVPVARLAVGDQVVTPLAYVVTVHQISPCGCGHCDPASPVHGWTVHYLRESRPRSFSAGPDDVVHRIAR